MTEMPAMFWSGETLSERLKTLIDPFVSGRVDCAAYTLSIGPEVYVSPNDQTTITIRKLSEGEAFTIPPGQFAFLLTEEVVSVPPDALAFISIRAKTKFRGLVNVSGFHVDPGYCGQLTFAVFNAGPVPVHLKRGQPTFLIWYASLDRETAFKKDGTVHKGIDSAVVTAIAGELQSFAGLSTRWTTAPFRRLPQIRSDASQRNHQLVARRRAHLAHSRAPQANPLGSISDEATHYAKGAFWVRQCAAKGQDWTALLRHALTGIACAARR